MIKIQKLKETSKPQSFTLFVFFYPCVMNFEQPKQELHRIAAPALQHLKKTL
jgi:hypothetical protein